MAFATFKRSVSSLSFNTPATKALSFEIHGCRVIEGEDEEDDELELEVAERVSSVTETVARARADGVCDSGGDIASRDSFVNGATFLLSESLECARFLNGR
jgi:hypothetical protein